MALNFFKRVNIFYLIINLIIFAAIVSSFLFISNFILRGIKQSLSVDPRKLEEKTPVFDLNTFEKVKGRLNW